MKLRLSVTWHDPGIGLVESGNSVSLLSPKTNADFEALRHVRTGVKFPQIDPTGQKTEALNMENKGCDDHDLQYVLIGMSVPTAIAATICLVSNQGWTGCLAAMLIGPIATAINGYIVWTANQNRAFSDVMSPTAGHDEWNAFQPVRHALNIRIAEKFKVARKPDVAYVAAFKRELSDPRRVHGRKAENLSAIAKQEMPGRRWQTHPLIDGCNERQVIN